MLLKRSFWAFAILVVLAAAGFARQGTFWEIHGHPVETAYTILAMKMGTQPSLSGYHVGGTVIRRRSIPEPGEGGRSIPVLSPLESDTPGKPSFAAWPPETNPFYFKPPMFPAILAYSHHQVLGPKLPFYPLLAGETEPPRTEFRMRAVFDLQSWAAAVPFLSGLAVILLTFILGWRLAGPGAGLLAAALTAAHPYQALTASHIWPEATLTVFLLLTAILLHYFLGLRSWAGCFAAGVVFALAVLTDHAALFVLPAIWLWTSAASGSASKPRLLCLFNPSIAAFLVGTLVIAQSWLGYVPTAFDQMILTRVDLGPSGIAAAAAGWVRGAIGLFLLCPPLAAAFRPKGEAVWPALIALSLVVMRWLYHPQAPWDERVRRLVNKVRSA